MHQSTKRQASFSRLAAGHVSTRRSDILLAATDSFCATERPDPTQISQYQELFYSLVGETNEVAKRLIASALSKHEYTPRQILIYFAMETAAIAAPVLAYSKGLGQFDLMQIIEKTSSLHHRVIANRGDLGSNVVNRLVETGDELTLRRLVQNKNLEDFKDIAEPDSDLAIEPEAPQLQADTAGISSPADEGRATPIIKSEPAEHNGSISSRISNRIHHHTIVTRPPAAAVENTDTVVDANAQTKVKLALDQLVTLANRGKKLGSIDDLLEDPQINRVEDFGDVMLDMTNRKDRQGQIIAIRNKFSLSSSTAAKIFEDHSGDTLAVLLKAGEIESRIALQIITRALPNVGLSDQNTTRMGKIYPVLETAACQKAVRSWQPDSKTGNAEYQPATEQTPSTDKQHSRAIPVGHRRDGEKTRAFGTRSNNALAG